MPVIHASSPIGNEKSGSESGVLGCFAVLRADHSVKVLLSNNHVIFNAAASPPVKVGSPSAGSCRSMCAKNIIAQATSPGVMRNFSGTYVDCAIARLESGVIGINQISALNPGNGFNGFLKGTASMSDNQRVFVCTNSGSLPNRIIPCRVVHAVVDLTASGQPQQGQSTLRVDPGFEQDPQFGSGDSGSIVVDEQNRVVGLMHSRGSVSSSEVLDLIIASPISAVMNALQIDILPESPPPPSSGLLLEDVPTLEEAPGISDPDLLHFQRLVKQSPTGLLLHDVGMRHGSEIVQLVHHCRPVTLTWHRHHGPAWAAHLINSARDPGYLVPQEIKGVSQHELLASMGQALQQNGSAALRADLDLYGPTAIVLAGAQSVSDLLARLGISDSLVKVER